MRSTRPNFAPVRWVAHFGEWLRYSPDAVARSMTPNDYTLNGIVVERGEEATSKLCSMPGCAGVAISFHAEIAPAKRGNGIGRLMHNARIKIAKASGFSVIMATVCDDNAAQLALMHDWKRLHTFTNARTGNVVHIYCKDLT